MKWYGYTNCSLKYLIINNKLRFQKIFNRAALPLKNKINLNFYKINFFLPTDWSFLILKKNNFLNLYCCYLYSRVYFYLLPVLTNFLTLKYDQKINYISLQYYFKNNFYNLFWIYFKTIFYSFSKIFFKKLKFKGKGYYIYKNNRNTIALQFGYSHRVYLYSFFIMVKFITKTIILMFGINNFNIINRSRGLFKLKPINVFTGRGIRFTRQIVYRKVGKISSYR